MPFINRFQIDEETGRAVVSEDAPASDDPYMAGFRFQDAEPNERYVVDTVVAINATFENGVARDEEGVMYVRIDDAPTGSDAVYLDGILCDTTGRMSLTTVNPIVDYMHGWPLDFEGSVCIIGGSGPEPPEIQTFDTLIVAATNPEQACVIDNLYFGTATDGGGYTTDQAQFLIDNPGLSLQTFEGFVADNATLQQSVFTGFSCIDPEPSGEPIPSIVGKNVLFGGTPSAVYASSNPGGSLKFTFSPAVSAVGCNLSATAVNPASNMTFTVMDGATVLTSQSYPNPINWTVFTAFAGYASTPVVAANNRVTADADTRVTADGDTRVWV